MLGKAFSQLTQYNPLYPFGGMIGKAHSSRSFFFQAEDGIRYHAQSRGLGDVYKRQVSTQSTWESDEELLVFMKHHPGETNHLQYPPPMKDKPVLKNDKSQNEIQTTNKELEKYRELYGFNFLRYWLISLYQESDFYSSKDVQSGILYFGVNYTTIVSWHNCLGIALKSVCSNQDQFHQQLSLIHI
eukprot:TRINITY_DN10139_c0_g1_i1.p1 TRINITY_DN10139_c0_g1~~TRINITY_DN10139_c0_g1_i1.p1  ORF type:complete len:186 (-),score=33.16 TRINITY_DN10139_c0_g1_i1:143-700(-)